MEVLNLDEIEIFSIELAKNAGKILLNFRDKAKILTTKSNALDVATEADIASETYMCDEIAKRFPSHGIFGEERGAVNDDREYVWVIDPLDGTIDYVRGMPYFGVLLALEYKRKPMLGCVHRPVANETFSGYAGGGVRKNRILVKVSQVNSLRDAIVHVKLPRNVNTEKETADTVQFMGRLAKVTGLIREDWEDAVSLAQIAAGSTEGEVTFKRTQSWWDFAPGIALVEEAGGKVSDLYGDPIKNRDLSRGVVASNGKIHDQLLQLIQE